MYWLRSVNVTTKSLRWGNGSGMIIERRVQFGLVELVMSLTSGWEDNTEEWWWGVSWMLFSVGVLKMVPAASNRGVCFGTPTALTAAEKCRKCAILIGTGRYAV